MFKNKFKNLGGIIILISFLFLITFFVLDNSHDLVHRKTLSGKWFFDSNSSISNNYEIQLGGGDIILNFHENGEVSGRIEGKIEKYFNCEDKNGCSKELLPSSLISEFSRIEKIPYGERILKYSDKIEGNIYGTYNGEEVIHLVADTNWSYSNGKKFNETYKLKGKIRDKDIKGIFSPGILEKSYWVINEGKIFLENKNY